MTSLKVAPPSRMTDALRVAKNIALFFGAPLVALAYVLLAPFVGFGLPNRPMARPS